MERHFLEQDGTPTTPPYVRLEVTKTFGLQFEVGKPIWALSRCRLKTDVAQDVVVRGETTGRALSPTRRLKPDRSTESHN